MYSSGIEDTIPLNILFSMYSSGIEDTIPLNILFFVYNEQFRYRGYNPFKYSLLRVQCTVQV